MNIMTLLPIGSVVRLAGASKKLMIYGICQTNAEDGKTYDYIAVLWPEGNVGAEETVLFQHTDIEEIVFRGYEDAESREFFEKLNAFYEAAQKEIASGMT